MSTTKILLKREAANTKTPNAASQNKHPIKHMIKTYVLSTNF